MPSTLVSGLAALPFVLPAVPGGFPMLFQCWVQDAAGPAGWAASNGLEGLTS